MDKEGDPQQSSELIAELPINARYENNLPQSMTMGSEQPASISKDKLSRINFLNGIYMPQYQKIRISSCAILNLYHLDKDMNKVVALGRNRRERFVLY